MQYFLLEDIGANCRSTSARTRSPKSLSLEEVVLCCSEAHVWIRFICSSEVHRVHLVEVYRSGGCVPRLRFVPSIERPEVLRHAIYSEITLLKSDAARLEAKAPHFSIPIANRAIHLIYFKRCCGAVPGGCRWASNAHRDPFDIRLSSCTTSIDTDESERCDAAPCLININFGYP